MINSVIAVICLLVLIFGEKLYPRYLSFEESNKALSYGVKGALTAILLLLAYIGAAENSEFIYMAF